MEILVTLPPMIVIGTDIVEAFFQGQAGHKGIKAARSQYNAWRAIAESAQWRTPQDVKTAHPKAGILKGGRVVFNIKANDYRLVAVVQYEAGVLMIRFFGSHEDYDKTNAETI
jgi:mRNA interferase HigB